MSLSLNNPWLISVLVFLWIASLLAMRFWTKRQLLRQFLIQEAQTEIPLPYEPRPEDETAREIIKTYRDGYLRSYWPETPLSFSAINDMSLKLIREIAAVYYPEEERPELKASLADLISFHNRVGSRLAVWLESAPIRPFKEVELGTVIRYYDMYHSIMEHPVSRFIQRHRLHRVAKWSWAAFNFSSPFYWGRQAAYELGRRLLLARVADLVGEEAMRLYGRRD
ncbi:MAG: hypothetical protein M1438_10745 [Deltaproteobacteria bacterium]|nr:hypothetical protein [Deltaproteobacteria bacterium]